MKRNHLFGLSLFSTFLLSLPWLDLLPGWILFIALLPLLIVEDKLNEHKTRHTSIVFFGYAWLCFWLWNVLTTWWIMHATLTGAILVIFLNATLMATIWWLFHLMKRRFHSRIASLSLVVFWIAFEYLHYNWEIEWPWLTLGNGFANQVRLIQWYQYTGVLGGTLWVLTVNLLVFQLYKKLTGTRTKKITGSIALILLAVFVPSWLSVREYNQYTEKGKSYDIIILQPNIDPYRDKFGGMSETDQVRILEHLTDSLLTDSTDYVIGPETALPPLLETPNMYRHPYLIPFHDLALTHPKLKFVLGAITQIRFQEGEEMPSTVRRKEDNSYYDVYNTALQIDASGKIQTYHKSILVSGVEKMPFSNYFSFLEKYIIDLGGTTGSLGSQEEPSNFISGTGLQAAPVICYESVFGEYLTGYVKKGAGLLFIMTNDGWWRNTPGYRQHLSFARLRAIETRRSIARSANTGISAFINQRGDILHKTKWWTRTALHGKLQANDHLTFYVRYGDYIGRISTFVSVLLLLYYLSQNYIKRADSH